MATGSLTQAEADALLAMEKHRVDQTPHEYPSLGGQINIPLVSADGREPFYLDVSRGRINLAKATYQNRARTVVPLARLDIEGPPHANPDGREIPCPHLHLYREGFGDKWAMPISSSEFTDTSDLWKTLHEFMTYCNITQPPVLQRSLFT